MGRWVGGGLLRRRKGIEAGVSLSFRARLPLSIAAGVALTSEIPHSFTGNSLHFIPGLEFVCEERSCERKRTGEGLKSCWRSKPFLAIVA
jgi:hypothetical protein